MRTALCLVLILTLFFSCQREKSITEPVPEDWPADTARILKNNLNFPWEILWGKDGFIWMTERGGKISKINPKTGDIVFSATLPDVVTNGEGGLLGMVQHPDFSNNGYFYVVYNYSNGGAYAEKIVLLRFINNNLQTVANIITNIPAASIHNGSRLWISGNKLFATTGDAASAGNAQLTGNLSGKVLRFNLDGSIPSDNPFTGSPVWSFGHRNPQGMTEVNGILYASEHGDDTEDEINIVEGSRNYGWPNVKGPCDNAAEISFCNANNIKAPLWSSGGSTIAVAGLDFYNHTRIPGWQNCLLMATLKDASLRVLKLSSNGQSVESQQQFFKTRFGRIRDICISPAGRVYLCTSNGGNADMLIEISKP
ncbi:MAG: PQQ-dependent sugar dehydrogenase [Ferruginibacter sp.]